MKSVVPGWARPCEMIGKEAGEYKLYGTTGEPCLFKRISPRDIEQGQEMSIESDGPGFPGRRFLGEVKGVDDQKMMIGSFFSHTHPENKCLNQSEKQRNLKTDTGEHLLPFTSFERSQMMNIT